MSENKKSKLREWFFIFWTNFFIFIFIMYAFEWSLRLTDPNRKLPHNGYIEGEYYTWGNKVENNSLGYREKEFFKYPKDEIINKNGVSVKGIEISAIDTEKLETFRIMVLGDSLTWGAGLAEEQRYTNLMENIINTRQQERRVEVLNFGLQGGPTITEREILKEQKDIVRPDLIIIGFCLNDPQPRSQDYTIEKEIFKQRYDYWINVFPEKFKIYGLDKTSELITKSIYNSANKFGILPSWQKGLDRTYEKESTEWKDFEQALRDIKLLSDQMGLPTPVFAILNQGLYSNAPTDYSTPGQELQIFLKWYHQAESTAKLIGYNTLNFEDEIAKKLPNTNLAVNFADGHPSKELNQVYAEKLSDYILENYKLK